MSNDTWLYVDFHNSLISRIIPLDGMSHTDIIMFDNDVPVPLKANNCIITTPNPSFDSDTLYLYNTDKVAFLSDVVGLKLLQDIPIHVVKDWVSNQRNLSDIQHALLSHANVGIQIYHPSKFDEVGYYIHIPSSIDVSAYITFLPVINHMNSLFNHVLKKAQ